LRYEKDEDTIICFFQFFCFHLSKVVPRAAPTQARYITPTSVDVTASATLMDLQQGRTLYINKLWQMPWTFYSPDNFSSTRGRV